MTVPGRVCRTPYPRYHHVTLTAEAWRDLGDPPADTELELATPFGIVRSRVVFDGASQRRFMRLHGELAADVETVGVRAVDP